MGQSNKDWRRNDEFALSKQATKTPATPSDNRPTSGGSQGRRFSTHSKRKPHDEKLAALVAYRKAKGLCFKCGLKWGSGHQCPEYVPLNVVEEIWQMLTIDESQATLQEESDSGDDLMALSVYAAHGTSGGKTIRLQGHIQQLPALLLVDSGSSHSFISEQFATNLLNWKLLKRPVQVKVADGGILTCTHELSLCDWLVQGVQFQTTFKILPLKCYDAILAWIG